MFDKIFHDELIKIIDLYPFESHWQNDKSHSKKLQLKKFNSLLPNLKFNLISKFEKLVFKKNEQNTIFLDKTIEAIKDRLVESSIKPFEEEARKIRDAVREKNLPFFESIQYQKSPSRGRKSENQISFIDSKLIKEVDKYVSMLNGGRSFHNIQTKASNIQSEIATFKEGMSMREYNQRKLRPKLKIRKVEELDQVTKNLKVELKKSSRLVVFKKKFNQSLKKEVINLRLKDLNKSDIVGFKVKNYFFSIDFSIYFFKNFLKDFYNFLLIYFIFNI